MAGFRVDIGVLQSAMSQIAGIADEVAGLAAVPEGAAGSVAAAFPESPANGVLLSVGQQLGSVLQGLANGTSDDVGTLGQNVANYLAADDSLEG